MKHIGRLIIISVLLGTTAQSFGQRWKLRRYEADFYLAAVSFHGDIGLANRPLANNINGLRPNAGLYAKFRITEDLTAGLDLGYIMYGGRDQEGSSHGRVYAFNSHAFQHVVRAEYFVLGEGRGFASNAIYNRRGMINTYNKLYMYVFAGAGGVLSKAKVKDLNNEGEEPLENPGYNNDTNYGFVFPVGAGAKFSFSPRMSLGFELGYQFTLTDYLDGYAPVYSQYNDSYYLTSLKLIYKIRNDRHGVPVFRRLYR